MKIVFGNGVKNSRRALFLFVFLISLSAFFVMSFAVFSWFKPVFEEKASNAARVKAVKIINQSVNDVFKDINAIDLMTLNKKENGEISSVTANSIEMNKLKTLLSLSLQNFTENSDTSFVHIPIGSLTPYPVLQGVGYRIPVKIMADGFSKIDFKSEFSQAGINQVKHRIYLVASVNISVISSAMTKTEAVTTEIPITETVIVGTVPTYYGDTLSVVGR